MPKVIILGGGVAGMSAAHELIERGFDVQVFERKIRLPGGKARSVPVPERTRELITIPFLVSTASDFSRDFTNMSLIPCGEFLFPETGMVSSTISCPRHM